MTEGQQAHQNPSLIRSLCNSASAAAIAEGLTLPLDTAKVLYGAAVKTTCSFSTSSDCAVTVRTWQQMRVICFFECLAGEAAATKLQP